MKTIAKILLAIAILWTLAFVFKLGNSFALSPEYEKEIYNNCYQDAKLSLGAKRAKQYCTCTTTMLDNKYSDEDILNIGQKSEAEQIQVFAFATNYCNKNKKAPNKKEVNKLNTPPIELFGIKILEDINNFSKGKIITFTSANKVFGEEEIKDPYLGIIRWFDGNDLKLIKNENFIQYNIYYNNEQIIEGIDGMSDTFDEDENFQICLNKKKELISLIVKLYNLDINNFKEQNYIAYAKEKPESMNDVISQSFFKFKYDNINLVYALACGFNTHAKTSDLWIELTTEKLENALYYQSFSKTKKSTEELLNPNLKGL
jgi:hypothetical protein